MSFYPKPGWINRPVEDKGVSLHPARVNRVAGYTGQEKRRPVWADLAPFLTSHKESCCRQNTWEVLFTHWHFFRLSSLMAMWTVKSKSSSPQPVPMERYYVVYSAWLVACVACTFWKLLNSELYRTGVDGFKENISMCWNHRIKYHKHSLEPTICKALLSLAGDRRNQGMGTHHTEGRQTHWVKTCRGFRSREGRHWSSNLLDCLYF